MEDVCQGNQSIQEKSRIRMGDITEVVLLYLCVLVCGRGVKRATFPLQPCQATLGFAILPCMSSCVFHHGHSFHKICVFQPKGCCYDACQGGLKI